MISITQGHVWSQGQTKYLIDGYLTPSDQLRHYFYFQLFTLDYVSNFRKRF